MDKNYTLTFPLLSSYEYLGLKKLKPLIFDNRFVPPQCNLRVVFENADKYNLGASSLKAGSRNLQRICNNLKALLIIFAEQRRNCFRHSRIRMNFLRIHFEQTYTHIYIESPDIVHSETRFT